MSWFWLPLLHLWSLFLCLYNSQFPAELVRCVCNICGDRGSELDLSPEPVRPCSAAQWWLHFFICSPSTECSGDVPSDAEVMVNWESLDVFFCAIADKDNSSFCCFLHVHCKRFFFVCSGDAFQFQTTCVSHQSWKAQVFWMAYGKLEWQRSICLLCMWFGSEI